MSEMPVAGELDAFLEAEQIGLHVPGLAVAVVQNGEVAHLGSYGLANIEFEVTVTPETLFQLASVFEGVHGAGGAFAGDGRCDRPR